MKKLFLVLTILLLISATGCSDDPSEEKGPYSDDTVYETQSSDDTTENDSTEEEQKYADETVSDTESSDTVFDNEESQKDTKHTDTAYESESAAETSGGKSEPHTDATDETKTADTDVDDKKTKKEKTYTGKFDRFENAAVILDGKGNFLIKAQVKDVADPENVSMFNMSGSLIMESFYTFSGTYTVSNDGSAVALDFEKEIIDAKLSGTAAEEYKSMIKEMCDGALSSGQISQKEYDNTMLSIDGVRELDISKGTAVILTDDKSMTFTVKDISFVA